MRRSIVALLILGLCSVPLLAMAGPGEGHRDGPGKIPPALMKKVMKDIGLTDKQIKQLKDHQFKADREKLDIRHELQKARLDLEQLMSEDQPKQSAVFSKIDKIGKLETELKKNRVGLMLKVKKLMTPEQWEKFEMMQAQRKMKRRERRRTRRFGGGPDARPAPSPMP